MSTDAAACMQSGTHSWGDCWPCSYAVIARDECKAHGGSDEVCEHLHSVPVAHVSYYAPQIAWWLSFFPPERFLVFTSQQLHDPQQQLDVRSFACPMHIRILCCDVCFNVLLCSSRCSFDLYPHLSPLTADQALSITESYTACIGHAWRLAPVPL